MYFNCNKIIINTEGEVVDAHVFETSKNNEIIDELLLATINNMPRWKPAEYSNDTKVKKEFVFAVGDMENCLVNLLNIRWLSPE